jgi:threonine/homoserine/homoserine lactone efflux protein
MEDHPIITLVIVAVIAFFGWRILKAWNEKKKEETPPQATGPVKKYSPIMKGAIFAEAALGALDAAPTLPLPPFIRNL